MAANAMSLNVYLSSTDYSYCRCSNEIVLDSTNPDQEAPKDVS